MKKLLKKATMLLCAMAVTIGFVGGTVEEVSAAGKYGGVSNLTISYPSNYSMGRIEVKSSWGASASCNILGVPATSKGTISGYSDKANKSVKLTVTYFDCNNKKVDSDSITVKAKELGNKSFNITFKKSGNYLKKVYIKKK